MKIKIIVLISILSFIVGCSPEMRLRRLLKNHPQLTDTSTILVSDTISISSVKDSISFKDSTVIDTLFITKDSARIRVIKKEGKVRIDYHKPEQKIPYVRPIHTINLSKQTIDKIEDKYKRKLMRRDVFMYVLLSIILIETLIIIVYVKKNNT